MKAKGLHMAQNSAKRRELLAIEAAEWVARSGLSDHLDCEQFYQWLTESPAHVKEFLAASEWKETLRADLAQWPTDVDQLLSQPNVVQIPIDTTPVLERPSRRFQLTRRWLIGFSAAAAAAIAMVAVPFFEHIVGGHVYSTDIGEQRTVALPDGSLVSMNTQSRVRVDYSDRVRNIHLNSGQALFSVAHEPQRPFRVYVDGTVVQAVGTKFDVRHRLQQTRVAVIEGRVQVSSAITRSDGDLHRTPPAKLAAGEGLNVLQTGEMTPPRQIDIKEATAWQQRRLVFVDHTLNDIVAEFERYTRTRIRIEDPAVGELRFSGVWDADRPDVLLTYLGKYGHVAVKRKGDEFVLRSLTDTEASEL